MKNDIPDKITKIDLLGRSFRSGTYGSSTIFTNGSDFASSILACSYKGRMNF